MIYQSSIYKISCDLFSMLLQEKKYALEVYNALNGSDYSDPEEIEIITTEHGVSLSIQIYRKRFEEPPMNVLRKMS